MIRNSQNEGVLRPQSVPVGGRLCQFVEGWMHITNNPYMLSIVTKGYRRFMSPPLLLEALWEIQTPKCSQKIQGIPSARMETLIQHYQAAGFSK